MEESIVIRPIHPDDEARMVRFHQLLGPDTVYARYFNFMGLRTRTDHERLVRVCDDHRPGEYALVAEARDESGDPLIVGVARLCRGPQLAEAEAAFVIADAWQGRGIGRRLMHDLIELAREHGIGLIWAEMMPSNERMHRTAERVGFTFTPTRGGTLRAELRVPAREPAIS